MKYTTETRLYSKNNKDIVAYFDEIKEQYNYILRKVYYIIRSNPKIKESSLNTELQDKYNISKRTANSIIKTVQGRLNSIKALKKTEVKQNQYRLERISKKLEKLIPMLSDLKLKARENNIKDLTKYRNLKTKVAFLKIRKDKLVNKIKSLNHQLETNKFKIIFGTKKLLKQSLEEFLNKRDNQMIFLGSKDETGCNSTFQLKYVSKINQFIMKVRKDFKYKNTKGEERYVYGRCFFNNHKKLLKEILNSKNSPLTYQIIKRINKLTELALRTGKDIVVEDLNFLKKKSKAMQGKSEKGKRYNKTLHSLAYRTFLDRAEQICNRENVGLIKVNPAWTSWIAKNKFCDKMKLNIHTGAAFVIARRGMNIKDVV